MFPKKYIVGDKMSKEEIIQFLKENLSIDIDSEYISDDCKAVYVRVSIADEQITSGVGYI